MPATIYKKHRCLGSCMEVHLEYIMYKKLTRNGLHCMRFISCMVVNVYCAYREHQ